MEKKQEEYYQHCLEIINHSENYIFITIHYCDGTKEEIGPIRHGARILYPLRSEVCELSIYPNICVMTKIGDNVWKCEYNGIILVSAGIVPCPEDFDSTKFKNISITDSGKEIIVSKRKDDHGLIIENKSKADSPIYIHIYLEDGTDHRSDDVAKDETNDHRLDEDVVIANLYLNGNLRMDKIDTFDWKSGNIGDNIHVTAKEYGGG